MQYIRLLVKVFIVLRVFEIQCLVVMASLVIMTIEIDDV